MHLRAKSIKKKYKQILQDKGELKRCKGKELSAIKI